LLPVATVLAPLPVSAVTYLLQNDSSNPALERQVALGRADAGADTRLEHGCNRASVP